MSSPDSSVASPPIEVVRPDFPRGPFRAAILDFDGTLSLLRRNWPDVMIPMMVDILLETGTSETREELTELVEEFVMRLNGRQTIYQMIQLCEEIKKRGGTPLDPLQYKRRYYQLMRREVDARVEAVRSGRVERRAMMTPGAEELLAALRHRGVVLYLASGTDLDYVRQEVDVLGLTPFFESRIYGALDDYQKFSKAMLIQQILRDTGQPGEKLLGLGDGFVEIEEVKRVGGLAVGVANNEDTREGLNLWKRNRLVRAGADIIVADFRRRDELLELIGA